MSESMKRIIDVSEETDPKLTKTLLDIAKKHDAALVAVIAPYVGRKITPTKTLSAHIGLSEEFSIETVIDEIKRRTKAKTLLLLINSPGGLVQSSYKVARALRETFKKIIVFVPHVAASGGTLVALTGNKIVMGMMSQLTPLDPHSKNYDGGKAVSANSVIDAHAFVTEFFKDTEVNDAPYTYKVLADKFDPVDIRDALADLSLMMEYICEILHGSGYSPQKSVEIAEIMVKGFKTHGDVITIAKAKRVGLHVVPDTKYPEEWKAFRDWLGKYLLEGTDKHIIRFVLSQDLRNTSIKKDVENGKPKSKGNKGAGKK